MTATDRAVELTVVAARAAADKQASEILALDVSDQLVITDAFLLAAAGNPRQVRAVVDAVEEAMKAAGATLVRREGVSDARWVLLDYADVVVHVQLAEDREYYALERLWKDGPAIALPDDVTGQVGEVGEVGRAGEAQDAGGAEPADDAERADGTALLGRAGG